MGVGNMIWVTRACDSDSKRPSYNVPDSVVNTGVVKLKPYALAHEARVDCSEKVGRILPLNRQCEHCQVTLQALNWGRYV